MAIITKPSILKGIAAQFSLDKSELSAISLVSNDSYFSDMSNWYRVNVIYKSSPGSQYEIVEFDATQESPVGHFLVSEKARDIFEVIKVKILDFDGGFLEIPRSSLTTADFDITFSGGEGGGEITPVSSFNYPDFSSTEGLVLLDTEGVVNNHIVLTRNFEDEVGNVWLSEAVRYDRNFSLAWRFECSGGGVSGADGFSLQWNSDNVSVGAIGGSVGVVPTNVNAFLFNTWEGIPDQFYYVQPKVHWNTGTTTKSSQDLVYNIREDVFYWADYDHSAGTFKIYYGNQNVKPSEPTHIFEGVSFDSGEYYFGMGAATGGFFDNHILKSLSITFEATELVSPEPVVNALLSTENDGDFEFSPDFNLNTSYVLSPGLELRGGFYTYRYVITTFLDASKAAEAGLVQGNSYKLRVYFNSFSTQVPDTITMTFRSGYNGSMPSITGAELLSSIQQLGYVDIPFDFFPFGDYLWIYENVPVEQSSEGATTFEISKIEVIE